LPELISVEIVISAKAGSQITTQYQEHSAVSASLDLTRPIDCDSSLDYVNESSRIDLMRNELGQSAPELSNKEYEESERHDKPAIALGQLRRIGEIVFYTGMNHIVSVS